MKEVIAMHGWCSDSKSWTIWKRHFSSNGWLWQSGERGYGTVKPFEPDWKSDKTNNSYMKKALICHSLGAHLLSSKLLSEARDIVFLNSFSRFIPKGLESRALKIGLAGMQKHLINATEKNMLIAFLTKASSPHDFRRNAPDLINQSLSSKGREKLQADLDILIKTNGLPTGISPKARVLVINGEEDKILHPSTKKDLLNQLNDYLNKPPQNWIIKGEGHSILQPKLIKDVRHWMDE